MLAKLRLLLSKQSDVTVPEIKECWGVTRKHVIPLLEYCDRQNVTTRSGDSRRAGPKLAIDQGSHE